MGNLLLTVNIVLPIFLVMAVGYVCRLTKLVNAPAVKVMNRLVFMVFLPVSIFKSLLNVDPSTSLRPGVFIFCVIGEVAIFALLMLIVPRFEKINARRGVIVQAIFRSNYAIFGIPLAEALFPEGDGGVAAMMIIATVPVFNVLAVVALETFRNGRPDVKKILLGVIKNPLIWSCIAGLIFMRLPFELPEFAMSTIGKLAAIASPLALFALGASIELSKIGANIRALICGVSGRLILVPIVGLTAAYIMGFRGPEFAALMIAFASPCAVNSYTMAAQMGGDEDLAGQMVMFSTVCSSVTIFLIVFLCKSLGIL